MFLRKQIINKPTGTRYCVSYCKDCHSQEIETISTCKKCGSHNIQGPSLFDDNKYGVKVETKPVTEYIYKCDICGKEFSNLSTSNVISYNAGVYEYGDYEDAEFTYSIEQDLCKECTNKLIDELNKEILRVSNILFVSDKIKQFMGR